MPAKYLENNKKAVDKIVKEGSIGKIDTLLSKFIEQFYSHVSPDYLASEDPKVLFGTANSLWRFIYTRKKTEKRKVRVYTPSKKEDGFEGNRTFLEISVSDMPFLIDSVTAELHRLGYNIFQVIHPVIGIERDGKGNIINVSEESPAESIMHFEITYIEKAGEKKRLEDAVENVLEYAYLAVSDWRSMLDKMKQSIDEVVRSKSSFDENTVKESKDFLNWIYNNNFTFLGFIEYKFSKSNKDYNFEMVEGSELGIFKMKDDYLRPLGFSSMPRQAVVKAITSNLIDITKSNRKAVVHRPVQMDYIGVKKFDKNGNISGEYLFIGLFTSSVYYQSATLIPIIRKKIEEVVVRTGFKQASHNGKTLITILETYPRDELLQISVDDLLETCLSIIELQKRPRIKLYARRDVFDRFISALIFIPRERFNTALRERIQKIIQEFFRGSVTDHYTQITDSPLARLHLIVKVEPGVGNDVDINSVENRLIEVTNSWHDGLRNMLMKRLGERAGDKLSYKYSTAFPETYVNKYHFGSAVCDINKIEEAIDNNRITFDFYKLIKDPKENYQLKIYHPEHQVTLSEILPVLENMGFHVIEESSYISHPSHHRSGVWVHHFLLKDNSHYPDELTSEEVPFTTIKKELEEALLKIRRSEIENDALNRLILRAGISWRDVEMLRGFSKYLVQTSFNYSHSFISEVISKHAHISKLLIKLFYARFVLDVKEREKNCAKIISEIEKKLLDVSNVAEDRTIRGVSDAIMATLRTNFFQKNAYGNYKNYISFKLDSGKVPNLPLPKPYAEIFVYSYRVEAIHLRGGKVARGGLRWSDRKEDFRTEVLGLMKAQMVKNAVIVPVGSKGGFVVKHPPENREAFMAEGIECYKTFLRGLLDITDNIVGGKIIPPKEVVRHDSDDPYLVVAADKGTATFSDIANSVSEEYGFWLGDAFASGGSAGYDHKKMGITARGGWVSVMRHFREMGVDIEKQEFTVAGIGDLAGDVFGNGMLLSDNMKLIAAFNHLHIFIDPNPDTKKSFKERQRMFGLPRSSWLDYDQKTLSKGGGIFERKAKAIKLSEEAKKALSISKDNLTPDELIKSILKAPVDLLWNGGIGTYVKAASEANEQVGDRANDSLRINGNELGCKVVGEGGNLGFTQLGRIEYSLAGGRINTDAIDNSAGVDCSDHEVNIKIAFSNALQKKKLTRDKRDKILADMTDEVASLVLRDNVLQTQALTIAELQGGSLIEQHGRFISKLEKTGLLKRKIEFLPDQEEVNRRIKERRGLTRPEISVLLAYSKMFLFNEIISSNLPDDPYFSNDLILYFPIQMQEEYKKEINEHQLRREIIATFVTNSMVNRVGITFASSMMDDHSLKGCDIARAYTVVRDSFNLRPLWREIETLDGKVDTKIQVEMFVEINSLIERTASWFMRNLPNPINVSKAVESYGSGIQKISSILEKILSELARKAYNARFERYKSFNVPDALAKKIAALEALASACDIVKVASKTKLDISTVGQMYYALGQRLNLGWLRICANKVSADSYWQRLSIRTIVNDFYNQQSRLTSEAIKISCDDDKCDIALGNWYEKNASDLQRYDNFISDLKSNDSLDSSMLLIAVRKLQEIGG